MKMIKSLKRYLLILCLLGPIPMQAQLIYKITPSSSIAISGTSTLSDWEVKSQKVSGEMSFTPSGKKRPGNAGQPGTIKNGKVILEASSLKSEKGETMDNKMYQALKSESYPQITFVLTDALELLETATKLSARGEVILAGVTREMAFELNVSREQDSYHVQGSRQLKLSDFQIDPPSAMFGQIVAGNEIVVKLDLVFAK